jgi:hypothetical protein
MKITKITFVLFLISLMFSCSQDDNTSNQENNDSLSRNSKIRIKALDLEYLGVEHNRVLDNYFQGVVQNNIKLNETKQFAYNTISQSVNIYETSIQDSNLILVLVDRYMDTSLDFSNSFYRNFEIEAEISSNLQTYLDELHSYVYNENETISETLSNINNLERSAESDLNLNNKDLAILFSGTNIAKHSLKYWDINLINWNRHGSAMQRGFWDDIRDVAGADVAGAVGGAVYAAV